MADFCLGHLWLDYVRLAVAAQRRAYRRQVHILDLLHVRADCYVNRMKQFQLIFKQLTQHELFNLLLEANMSLLQRRCNEDLPTI